MSVPLPSKVVSFLNLKNFRGVVTVSQLQTNFSKTLKDARLRLLELHFNSKSGHLGGNLSCIDAIMTLFHLKMEKNDRFILSKGHSAGALYVALWSQGKLSDAELLTFCKDDTHLPGHPSGQGIPGLMFSTGSLGHGPSLAAGLALAGKTKKESHQIYCLCSDGEWQEGSCWEALTFATHQNLSNLTIIIDQNKLQGFGTTSEVISCEDLAPRISAFGIKTLRANGHNFQEIFEALNYVTDVGPKIIILDTIKGRGTHYENKMESHYLPLTEEQFIFAKSNIGGEDDK